MDKAHDRLTLLILLAVLAVVYVFVFSSSGLLERIELKKHKAGLAGRIAELREENSRLRQTSSRYRNGDFMPEEAQKAGYVEPGTKLLFFNRGDAEAPSERPSGAGKEKYSPQISHLRILWLVVSILVLFFYFVRRSRYREEQL